MIPVTNFTEAQNALRQFYGNATQPYTLDTMVALMDYIGNPQEKVRVLHVAGTSGKTSTAYYCAALLQAAGKTVGLTVSPHVDNLNERVQVNGRPLPEVEFCTALSAFLNIIRDAPVRPSYFELMVALAFWYFADRQLDYAVIEVGLGGLLDATNVVHRSDKLCLITDIGLDHTEILGNTLSAITEQKAGIIQTGNTVFMQEQNDAVMAVAQKVARRQSARLTIATELPLSVWSRLPPFQRRNLGLAVTAIESLIPVDHAKIRTAAVTIIPARLERFARGEQTIIIDGSHNKQKIDSLMAGIRELYPKQSVTALCGFTAGSDVRWKEALLALYEQVDHIIFTTFYNEMDLPKASVTIHQINTFCVEQGITDYGVAADTEQAYRLLLRYNQPILLVTGSFYLLNTIRPLMSKTK